MTAVYGRKGDSRWTEARICKGSPDAVPRFRIGGRFVVASAQDSADCYMTQNAGLALVELENLWSKKAEADKEGFRSSVLLL